MSVTRRSFLKSAGIAAGLAFSGLSCRNFAGSFSTTQGRGRREKPNFLFILVDDMGWSQLGCYGSDFYRTPNIDALAAEGMRFTDAYAAAPVCSPTRASIMTGKYPARLHLTDFIAGNSFPYAKYTQPRWQKFLPLREVTIGEALGQQGYVTASLGKWHLSQAKRPPESLPYNPDRQGFDRTLITYKPDSRDNPEEDPHNVGQITDRALEFIEDHTEEPFFLLVSHNSIHSPLLGRRELVGRYRKKPGVDDEANNPVLAAMIEDLDSSVGRLLDKLDESGLAEDTVVIFFSDNGGLKRAASQYPLRSGKANLYEGGIRVPLIVRWPGKVRRSGICAEPVISTDFFPTILDIAGLRMAENPELDGVSLVDLLTERGKPRREALYWHYPHYHTSSIGPCGAVRRGRYKLIEWYDLTRSPSGKRYELYDLADDIGESKDISAAQPGRAERLADLLARWRENVSAQMLEPNPNYDQAKADRPRK